MTIYNTFVIKAKSVNPSNSLINYGETLLEEQKPFMFINENSSEEDKAEEAFYEKVVPNFKNYGKMTI